MLNRFIRKTFICPHCFHKDSLHNVLFLCENDEHKGPPDSHIIQAKERHKFMQWLLPFPTKGYCNKETCLTDTYTRLCPNCQQVLPDTIGHYKNLVFSIVGSKESGKSHYIAVLIEEIKKTFSSTHSSSLIPISDEVSNHYHNYFYQPVYERQETIHATMSARTNPDLHKPLIYNLHIQKKRWFFKSMKVITLVFFDSAGEDLDAEDVMKRVNKYIYLSDGIIFLFDPLQLKKVREKLANQENLPNVNTDANELLGRMTRLIRRGRNIKPNKKIKIPTAITLTKIDLFKNVLDSSSPLLNPSNHLNTEGFDLTDFLNVNANVESEVKRWSDIEFPNLLENNFQTYAYFGVSSLGSNPDRSQKIHKIEPLRIEDPFLWLLAEYKVLKKVKEK